MMQFPFLMILFIEIPGTVEFEFGTLQAQSRGGLLPSTWLPLIFNPAFKISPWFYIPPPGRPQSEKGNFVIIFYDSNYRFYERPGAQMKMTWREAWCRFLGETLSVRSSAACTGISGPCPNSYQPTSPSVSSCDITLLLQDIALLAWDTTLLPQNAKIVEHWRRVNCVLVWVYIVVDHIAGQQLPCLELVTVFIWRLAQALDASGQLPPRILKKF